MFPIVFPHAFPRSLTAFFSSIVHSHYHFPLPPLTRPHGISILGWWGMETIEMFRKLLITSAIRTMVETDCLSIIISLVVCALCMFFYAFLKPYNYAYGNFAQVACHCGLVAIYAGRLIECSFDNVHVKVTSAYNAVRPCVVLLQFAPIALCLIDIFHIHHAVFWILRKLRRFCSSRKNALLIVPKRKGRINKDHYHSKQLDGVNAGHSVVPPELKELALSLNGTLDAFNANGHKLQAVAVRAKRSHVLHHLLFKSARKVVVSLVTAAVGGKGNKPELTRLNITPVLKATAAYIDSIIRVVGAGEDLRQPMTWDHLIAMERSALHLAVTLRQTAIDTHSRSLSQSMTVSRTESSASPTSEGRKTYGDGNSTNAAFLELHILPRGGTPSYEYVSVCVHSAVGTATPTLVHRTFTNMYLSNDDQIRQKHLHALIPVPSVQTLFANAHATRGSEKTSSVLPASAAGEQAVPETKEENRCSDFVGADESGRGSSRSNNGTEVARLRAQVQAMELATISSDGSGGGGIGMAFFQHASDELRADRTVVIEAVKQNGFALEYASDELRADRTVVIEAVKQNGFALEYASDELRADRGVIEEATKTNAHALLQRKSGADTRGGRYQPGADCELVVHANEGDAEESIGLETDETSGDEEGEADTVINHVWV